MFTYYLAINVITFFVWGYDKLRAKLQQWRIPEITLYVIIILGGGVGALLGMTVFRHKTKKLRFKVFAVIGVIVHTIIFFYFLD